MDKTKPQFEANQVDSWIDDLDVTKPPRDKIEVKMEDSLATWFVQQGLPRIEIPWFDGSPEHYVELITSFKDLVHEQGYLSILQRCIYLHQAVKGEVKRSIQGYRNDYKGYVMALTQINWFHLHQTLQWMIAMRQQRHWGSPGTLERTFLLFFQAP